MRLFVRAASGRQRYNVLGAWNVATQELVRVTNHTYVTAETVCELLRKIAALSLGVPITLVLDNARYQRCVGARLGPRTQHRTSFSPLLLAEPQPD